MLVDCNRSSSVLVDYLTNSYYARCHNPSYQKYRETHFRILFDVKF